MAKTKEDPSMKIFVGSSARIYSEIANPIIKALRNHKTRRFEVLDWSDSFTYKPLYDSLVNLAKDCDIGLFIFGADRQVKMSDGTVLLTTSENVIFESGMFAATRPLANILIIKEQNVVLPSDLSNYVAATWTLPATASEAERIGHAENLAAEISGKAASQFVVRSEASQLAVLKDYGLSVLLGLETHARSTLALTISNILARKTKRARSKVLFQSLFRTQACLIHMRKPSEQLSSDIGLRRFSILDFGKQNAHRSKRQTLVY